MQTKELLAYIHNPYSITPESVNQLHELVQHYPYFQPAHLLYCFATKEFDIASHQQVLKKTAISITNRVVLHDLLNKQFQTNNSYNGYQKENIKAEPLKEIISQGFNQKSEEKNESLSEIKTVLQQIKEDINVLKATELAETNKIAVNKELTTEIQTKAENKAENVNIEITELEDGIQKAASEAFLNETYFDSTTPEKEPEPANFIEWINYLNAKKGATADEIKQTAILAEEKSNPKLKNSNDLEENSLKIAPNLDKKQKNSALIDKIIQSNPGAIRTKDEKRIFAANAQAKESLLENEHLVTETLAKIYALQGHISKAIRAYEILSLKIPQKSVYFASLIKELREKQ